MNKYAAYGDYWSPSLGVELYNQELPPEQQITERQYRGLLAAYGDELLRADRNARVRLCTAVAVLWALACMYVILVWS